MTRFLGPLIIIIKKMLRDLAKFLVIYSLVLVVFSCTGYMIFIELDSFKDKTNSLFTMFYCSIGSFDLKIFDKTQFIKPVYGMVFFIIYLTTTLIILLNFLIALMSDTYTTFKVKGNLLYL